MRIFVLHQYIVRIIFILSIGASGIIIYWLTTKVQSTPKVLDTHNETSSVSEIYDTAHAADYGLAMNKPTFEGMDGDSNKYEIIANQMTKAAINHYQLEDIVLRYHLSEGDLICDAKEGVIANDTKIVKLRRDVHFILNDAILNSPEMDINLSDQHAYSTSGVHVLYHDSHVESNMFSSDHKTGIVNFKGKVRVTIPDIDL